MCFCPLHVLRAPENRLRQRGTYHTWGGVARIAKPDRMPRVAKLLSDVAAVG